MTAQGHPRAIFNRAIEHGSLADRGNNLAGARAGLRCFELLDLTALIAVKDVGRHGRVAARWLFKYLEAKDDATIEDAALAAGCLSALGGPPTP